MGDLGEPPVISAGFSDEVALSRGSYWFGLSVATGGGSQRAESVVSAGERSQSRQPHNCNNVFSGSQTDVLPAQVPKANVTTERTAKASHRPRKQDANFACTLPGWIHIYTWLLQSYKGHLRSHFVKNI